MVLSEGAGSLLKSTFSAAKVIRLLKNSAAKERRMVVFIFIFGRCFNEFIRITFSQTFFHSLLAADAKTASQTLAVSRASRKVGWHGSPLVSEARKSAT